MKNCDRCNDRAVGQCAHGFFCQEHYDQVHPDEDSD